MSTPLGWIVVKLKELVLEHSYFLFLVVVFSSESLYYCFMFFLCVKQINKLTLSPTTSTSSEKTDYTVLDDVNFGLRNLSTDKSISEVRIEGVNQCQRFLLL